MAEYVWIGGTGAVRNEKREELGNSRSFYFS